MLNFNKEILNHIFEDPSLKEKFLKELSTTNKKDLTDLSAKEIINSLGTETKRNKLINFDSFIRNR